MALSHPLVTAGYAGSFSNRWASMALFGKAVWTETGALPFTTTQSAPGTLGDAGDPIVTVVAPVDVIVAVGPGTPNATTGPRYFAKANEPCSFYAQPGDRVALVAA